MDTKCKNVHSTALSLPTEHYVKYSTINANIVHEKVGARRGVKCFGRVKTANWGIFLSAQKCAYNNVRTVKTRKRRLVGLVRVGGEGCFWC